MIVIPKCVKSFNADKTTDAEALSKPLVGSSKKIIEGSATNSIPILTRFLCPPLIPLFSTEPTTECLIFSSSNKLYDIFNDSFSF